MLILPNVARRAKAGLFRNSLAFPAGVTPGFDPSHLVGGGTVLSVVPRGTTFYDIITDRLGTITTAPTAVQKPIGSTLFQSIYANRITFGSMPTATPTSFTWGGFLIVNAYNGSGVGYLNGLFQANNANSGPEVTVGQFNNSATQSQIGVGYAAGGSAISGANVTVSTGVPYFVAASIVNAATANVVVTNLITGATRSISTSGTYTATAPSSTYTLGAAYNVYTANSWLGPMMYSTQGSSLAELLAWAGDPWSFWYPEPQNRVFGGLILNVSPAITGATTLTSAGNITPSVRTTPAGATTLSSAGTFALNPSATLVGAGTLGTAGDITRNTTIALSGAQTLGSAGGAIGSPAAPVSGAQTFALAGNFVKLVDAFTTGAGALDFAGPVAAITGAFVPLTGAQTLGSAGTITVTSTRSPTVALTGATTLGTSGSIVASLSASPTGAQTLGSAASVTGKIAPNLTGAQTLALAGSVSVVTGTVATITGVTTLASVGTLTKSITRALSGATTFARAGTVAAGTPLFVLLSGAYTYALAGLISVRATQFIPNSLIGGNTFEHGDTSREFTKYPDAVNLVSVNFDNEVTSADVRGATIVSVSPVTSPPLVVASVSTPSEPFVASFLVSGGVVGTSYEITLQTSTTFQTLVDFFELTVVSEGFGAYPVTPYGDYLPG